MDYVVFGIGMGASLVLLGLAGRAVGPSLRYRRSSETGDVLKAEELVARIAWARFCSSLGAALAIGGVFLLIVTGVTMAIRIDDTAAAVAVGLALLAIVVLMVVWTWAFVDRFGLYGIVAGEARVREPRQQKPDRPKKQTPAKAKTPSTPPKVDTAHSANQPVAPANPEPEQPKLSPAKRALQPWSSLAEAEPKPPMATPTTRPISTVDASRSEVINPSDAAALDRILSEPELDVPIDSIVDADREEGAEAIEENPDSSQPSSEDGNSNPTPSQTADKGERQ